ncbi:MAG: hypothetical protein ACRENC_18880, partial [Gemmatimonadaceae bacterium]
MKIRVVSGVIVALSLAGGAGAQTPAANTSADPFLWLEAQHGARAMAWVDSQNVRTMAVLEKDPHYAALY